jgi:hypothetical protein
MFSAHISTHSLQIATAGVGPATIDATAARGFPQNEQRIESADRLGPAGSSVTVRTVRTGYTVPRTPPQAAHHRPTQL